MTTSTRIERPARTLPAVLPLTMMVALGWAHAADTPASELPRADGTTNRPVSVSGQSPSGFRPIKPALVDLEGMASRPRLGQLIAGQPARYAGGTLLPPIEPVIESRSVEPAPASNVPVAPPAGETIDSALPAVAPAPTPVSEPGRMYPPAYDTTPLSNAPVSSLAQRAHDESVQATLPGQGTGAMVAAAPESSPAPEPSRRQEPAVPAAILVAGGYGRVGAALSERDEPATSEPLASDDDLVADPDTHEIEVRLALLAVISGGQSESEEFIADEPSYTPEQVALSVPQGIFNPMIVEESAEPMVPHAYAQSPLPTEAPAQATWTETAQAFGAMPEHAPVPEQDLAPRIGELDLPVTLRVTAITGADGQVLGRVTELTGTNEWTALNAGLEGTGMVELRTAQRGEVQVLVDDQATVILGAQTRALLKRTVDSGEPGGSRISVDLIQGRVLVSVIAQGVNVTVHTPERTVWVCDKTEVRRGAPGRTEVIANPAATATVTDK